MLSRYICGYRWTAQGAYAREPKGAGYHLSFPAKLGYDPTQFWVANV